MLARILIAVVVVVLGLAAYIATRPGEFQVVRSATFAATNSATFSLREEGGRTAVSWSMSGRNNFVGKAMCLVFDMDKMVGGDFEAGLAGIKSIVEKK
jgi:hypothetical protein